MRPTPLADEPLLGSGVPTTPGAELIACGSMVDLSVGVSLSAIGRLSPLVRPEEHINSHEVIRWALASDARSRDACQACVKLGPSKRHDGVSPTPLRDEPLP